jgi:hypothetical protein
MFASGRVGPNNLADRTSVNGLGVKSMMTSDSEKDWINSLPFPKHWLGYIAIKLIVLAFGAYLVLRWQGVL